MLTMEEIAQKKFQPIIMLQKANGVQNIMAETINIHNGKITVIETLILDVLVNQLHDDLLESL